MKSLLGAGLIDAKLTEKSISVNYSSTAHLD